MVFFNCNACGESLKKNQVEKHYQFKCRKCEVLSCVDCGKEFWGNDYEQHTKCMTEEEKYSGKNYKPKPNANKGEAKQELWIEQVQHAIDKVTANPQLKQILEKVKDYPNIPRKKPKFINFLGNSLRVRGHLAEQAWDKISAEIKKPAPCDNSEGKLTGNDATENEAAANQPSKEHINDDAGEGRRLNKRERKEERQKRALTGKKKDNSTNEIDKDSHMHSKKHKKHKKRKHEEDLENAGDGSVGSSEKEDIHHKKKKRKHQNECEESDGKKGKINGEEDDQRVAVEDGDHEECTQVGKFSWESIIISVLQASSDNEVSVKKLKKKVLAEYAAQGGDAKIKTEEKLLAKFNKKIHKNPRLRVLKERVKLLH